VGLTDWRLLRICGSVSSSCRWFSQRLNLDLAFE